MLRKANKFTSLAGSFALAAAGLAPDVQAHKTPAVASVFNDRAVAEIIVDKSDRRMELLDNQGDILRSYRIGLGFDPRGDKVRQGDGRTPEGRYIIEGRNPQSSYTLSLRISYPDAADKQEARARGVDPGGDIYIHGNPTGKTDSWTHRRGQDWTFGCIAVKNRDIREIYTVVKNGTPITIQP